MNDLGKPIMHYCNTCNRHFVLFENEKTYTELEGIYTTCPYNGKHKSVIVCNKFDNLSECRRNANVYKRINGRMKQIK